METKSYQTNELVVRSFLGKQHLSLPLTGSTIDEIDHLENVVTDDDAHLDDEQEHLAAVTVTGIHVYLHQLAEKKSY